MKLTWLLIANATKAYLFDITKSKQHTETVSPTLLETLVHPQGRAKGIELQTDKSGHYSTPSGSGGKFIEKTTPHDIELEIFAHEIINYLTHTDRAKSYQALIICAEPHFLGILTKELPDSIKKLIIKTIGKDYIPLPKDELITTIKEIQHQIH
ncbi:MAG: hypothetical protein A3E87_06235 [Gammaproteobacteria bacterium RIFCSPHIGHO2_12_FULL_35_23]|nr:MAG: hypothetical protein A3E87_06235 [Gammaproteobacteria bacterium RIFCSPHIGHO2_12_FULL_35_23]